MGRVPNSLRLLVVLSGLVCATGGFAAPRGDLPRDEEGVREAQQALSKLDGTFEIHETAHYTLIYNGERRVAIERGQLLENLYTSYFTFLKRVKIAHGPLSRKLVVLVFEHEDDFQAYSREDGLGDISLGAGVFLQGYYSSFTNRSAFFNQRKGGAYQATKQSMERMAESLMSIEGPPDTPVRIFGPDGVTVRTKREVGRDLVRMKKEMVAEFKRENLTVTQHEGAHQLAFNSGLQKRGAPYPFWVSEGLACMFETPGDERGFGAFRVNSERLARFREASERGTALGMSRLVTLPTDSRENLMDLYAESWALFFFLARTRPVQLSAYLQDLAGRESGVTISGADEWALFAGHFAPKGDDLELQWRNFLKRLR